MKNKSLLAVFSAVTFLLVSLSTTMIGFKWDYESYLLIRIFLISLMFIQLLLVVFDFIKSSRGESFISEIPQNLKFWNSLIIIVSILIFQFLFFFNIGDGYSMNVEGHYEVWNNGFFVKEITYESYLRRLKYEFLMFVIVFLILEVLYLNRKFLKKHLKVRNWS